MVGIDNLAFIGGLRIQIMRKMTLTCVPQRGLVNPLRAMLKNLLGWRRIVLTTATSNSTSTAHASVARRRKTEFATQRKRNLAVVYILRTRNDEAPPEGTFLVPRRL